MTLHYLASFAGDLEYCPYNSNEKLIVAWDLKARLPKCRSRRTLLPLETNNEVSKTK